MKMDPLINKVFQIQQDLVEIFEPEYTLVDAGMYLHQDGPVERDVCFEHNETKKEYGFSYNTDGKITSGAPPIDRVVSVSECLRRHQ